MVVLSAARSLPGGHEKSHTYEHAPLTQSRETGDVIPESRQGDPIVNRGESVPVAKSWAHMVAGGYVLGFRAGGQAQNAERPRQCAMLTLHLLPLASAA